jgi:polyhydroxyalkanoate synthase subunit PhaC
LNPPGNPKATFITGAVTFPEADAFLANAEKKSGSWWTHWSGWLSTRSGAKVAAPAHLGSDEFPAREPAPGTYVFQ